MFSIGKEDLRVSFRDAGTVLLYAGLSFFVPIVLSIFLDKNPDNLFYYSISAIGLFATGYFLRHFIKAKKETETKHAMLSIVIIWLVYCFFASLPFLLIMRVSFVDAFFEAMSSLTTTGLTVMIPFLDTMPKSLIFWRTFLGWIGGIGIVLMAFIGLMTTYSKTTKLLSAEGRGDQLKENLKTSVTKISMIYVVLTIIGILLLVFAGQTVWEATNYSMSAISTNGMDITTEGLTGVNNGWIPRGVNNYWVNIVLVGMMIIGATSFAVHFGAFKKKSLKFYLKDPEFRTLILLGLIGALIVSAKLGLLTGFFHSFSQLTAGGLTLVSPSVVGSWDDFVKMVIITLTIIGGSAGSTAGGIKISRIIIFVKSIYWKIKEKVLPENSYFKKSYNEQTITSRQIKEINQFILIWIIFILIGVFVVSAHGYDMGNALFEVSSAQSNAGISAGITQQGMPIGIQIMLIINMFVGRLEIIPLMVSFALIINFKERKKR